MRKTKRPAYTLMEVVLVCAVLVIAMAISIPVVSNMFSSSHLDTAKDSVKQSFVQARTLAVKESRPYCFEVQENRNQYRIRPDDNESSGIVQALPENVVFCCASSNATSEEAGWTTVAVFLPDGTAQEDSEIGIRLADAQQPVMFRLKAATGSVSIAALASLANPS